MKLGIVIDDIKFIDRAKKHEIAAKNSGAFTDIYVVKYAELYNILSDTYILSVFTKDHMGFVDSLVATLPHIPVLKRPSVIIFDNYVGNTIEEATRIDYELRKNSIKPVVCNELSYLIFNRLILGDINFDISDIDFVQSFLDLACEKMASIDIIDQLFDGAINGGSLLDIANRKPALCDYKAIDGCFGFWGDCNIKLTQNTPFGQKDIDISESLSFWPVLSFYNKDGSIFKIRQLENSIKTYIDMKPAEEIKLVDVLTDIYNLVYAYLCGFDSSIIDSTGIGIGRSLRVHNIISKLLIDNMVQTYSQRV